jgi:hypothetical protein
MLRNVTVSSANTSVRKPSIISLRKKPAFTKLLRRAEKQHGEAAAAFERVAGDTMFGAASP